MANTLSVMTNVLRNVVSKQRIRYKEKGFNLDLAYICDNIIAMGYPADNIEKIYRNRLEDVYKFLEENHSNHYKIYNLCSERSYDINKFHKRVAIYPFEDHNPPTIELIQSFCSDVDTWLKSHKYNVAAVHCKAGKGRTGTMICCYLLYSKLHQNAEDALAFYDEKRTKDKKGVTIPSQRRYVQYFSRLINSGHQYEKTTLKLREIHFSESTHLQSLGVVHCSIYALQDSSYSKQELLHKSIIDFRQTSVLLFDRAELFLTGDIKVELTHRTSKKGVFHFWFNTYFVMDSEDITKRGQNSIRYTLHKWEIDDAHKDKEHKCFSEDFKVQMFFCNEVNNKKITINSSQYCNLDSYYNSEQGNLDDEILVLEPTITAMEHNRTQEIIISTNVISYNNDQMLNGDISNLNINAKSVKGGFQYENLEISHNATCRDIAESKILPFKNQSHKKLNKLDKISKIKTTEVAEGNLTDQSDITKDDNTAAFHEQELNFHLSIGRNNSNTSSTLSNNSNKQCVLEDDWESGESTYL